jgi:hypothetical protein
MASKKTKKPTVSARKPPTPAEFVSGTTAGPASTGTGMRGGLKTLREVKTGTYAGQIEARVTVSAPVGLLEKARIYCVQNRTSLSAIFIEALTSRVGS